MPTRATMHTSRTTLPRERSTKFSTPTTIRLAPASEESRMSAHSNSTSPIGVNIHALTLSRYSARDLSVSLAADDREVTHGGSTCSLGPDLRDGLRQRAAILPRLGQAVNHGQAICRPVGPERDPPIQ